mgnify:FL=1|tara:strand:+ start:344 stop:787 length:444 start_codon:yes stop_codon:yes gene_type:complete
MNYKEIFNNIQNQISENKQEENTKDTKLEQYKKDFLDMNVGSLNAIMNHAKSILESLDDESIKENLTESWLQGKIAVTEDYMRTIHDFVKYASSNDDDTKATNRPGLWENIRRKKQREGDNYKPAKPGDPDRPTPEQLKRAQKKKKK